MPKHIEPAEAALIAAMRPYETDLRNTWRNRGDFERLQALLVKATTNWKDKVDAFREATKGAQSVFVYCGQRCLPPGSDQLASVLDAVNRAKKLNSRPYVMYSGNAIKPLAHEIDAWEMHRRVGLIEDCPVSIDAQSTNTGDQAYMVKGWIEGHVRSGLMATLVVCLPIEHIGRWVLTFASAWRELPQLQRERLRVLCYANGAWGEETREGLTRAQEAFALVNEKDSATLCKMGGQYGKRLYNEMYGPNKHEYRCPALPPAHVRHVFDSLF